MRIHTSYHMQGSIRATSEASIHNPNSKVAQQRKGRKFSPRAESKMLEQVPIEQCLNCTLKECRANARGECLASKDKTSTP